MLVARTDNNGIDCILPQAHYDARPLVPSLGTSKIPCLSAKCKQCYILQVAAARVVAAEAAEAAEGKERCVDA